MLLDIEGARKLILENKTLGRKFVDL